MIKEEGKEEENREWKKKKMKDNKKEGERKLKEDGERWAKVMSNLYEKPNNCFLCLLIKYFNNLKLTLREVEVLLIWKPWKMVKYRMNSVPIIFRWLVLHKEQKIKNIWYHFYELGSYPFCTKGNEKL